MVQRGFSEILASNIKYFSSLLKSGPSQIEICGCVLNMNTSKAITLLKIKARHFQWSLKKIC